MALTHPSDADASVACPAAPGLRTVDPTALTAARALAKRLAGTAFGDGTLTARLCWPPHISCWLVAADARMAIATIEGARVTLHPERIDAIVAALDQCEPVFDAIEEATGLVLEFNACAEPDSAPAVEVRAADADGTDLAVFYMTPLAPLREPDAPPLLTSAVLPVSRTVQGPRLSIDDASGIGVGDMLMLHAGAWSIEARAATGSWTGLFDAADGIMAVGHPGAAARKDSAMTTEEPPASNDRLDAFAVPIAIALPDGSATVGELAGLTAGSTLMLGPVAAGLDVELRVADRAIASGELVRLGESYAVLITSLPAAPAAPAATD